jgi:uncharacterized membrane-anchored protein
MVDTAARIASPSPSGRPSRADIGKMLSKVPEVTVFFWIIKVLATTVGETAADYLNPHLHLGLTGVTFIMTALLIVALVFQFRAKGYVPGVLLDGGGAS